MGNDRGFFVYFLLGFLSFTSLSLFTMDQDAFTESRISQNYPEETIFLASICLPTGLFFFPFNYLLFLFFSGIRD